VSAQHADKRYVPFVEVVQRIVSVETADELADLLRGPLQRRRHGSFPPDSLQFQEECHAFSLETEGLR
jgi:hypothetical protein